MSDSFMTHLVVCQFRREFPMIPAQKMLAIILAASVQCEETVAGATARIRPQLQQVAGASQMAHTTTFEAAADFAVCIA